MWAAHLLGSDGPTLHLLDEPATGLHEADLQRLVGVLRELAARGDLVVMAEHHCTSPAVVIDVVVLLFYMSTLLVHVHVHVHVQAHVP